MDFIKKEKKFSCDALCCITGMLKFGHLLRIFNLLIPIKYVLSNEEITIFSCVTCVLYILLQVEKWNDQMDVGAFAGKI